jgi:hypothetical protein
MLPFCRAQTFVNSAFVQPRADVYLAVKWGTTGQPAMDKNLVHVIMPEFGRIWQHRHACFDLSKESAPLNDRSRQ